MENLKPFEPVPNSDGKQFREAINVRLKDLYDRVQELESKVEKDQS